MAFHPETLQIARELLTMGFTTAQIADYLKVSVPTVSRILSIEDEDWYDMKVEDVRMGARSLLFRFLLNTGYNQHELDNKTISEVFRKANITPMRVGQILRAEAANENIRDRT